MTELPIAKGDPMGRMNRLYAEKRFRQQALFRMYPGCTIRGGAGSSWDMNGPEVVLVILHEENTHGVYYDHELTLLSREIGKEMAKTMKSGPSPYDENTKPWPLHDHPIVQMNQLVDYLIACACDENTWKRDDVQDLYANMMGKNPLDRIVEGVPED